MERAMLAAKRYTRAKVSSKAEIVALQLDLDQRALERVALELGIELDGGAEADGAAGAAAPLVYNTGTRSGMEGSAALVAHGGVRDAGHAIPMHAWADMQVRKVVGWLCERLLQARPPTKIPPTT